MNSINLNDYGISKSELNHITLHDLRYSEDGIISIYRVNGKIIRMLNHVIQSVEQKSEQHYNISINNNDTSQKYGY